MPSDRYQSRGQWILTVCIAVLGALTVIGATILYPGSLGIEQPIPFSHRVHAGDKQISCLMCHSHALTRAVAGIPPVETCMLCHSRIIIHYPPIEEVRGHYEKKQPLLWARVSDLPDLVHFNHSVHLAAGFDCGRCHGAVKAMDRIVPQQRFRMGFCIQCHRENNATHDCFACHY
jgi:hypothetical protein